jgi:hypothetical protein
MMYPSPAPSPVRRRRERPPEVASSGRYRENDSSSGMVPRPQSPHASNQRGGPQRPVTAAAGGGGGGRSARAGSASRRSRSSSRGRAAAAAAAAGYRRSTAASLSHEPVSVSERASERLPLPAALLLLFGDPACLRFLNS